MKKIVYVTGCLGFIGVHIVQKCLDQGWFVHGVDKKTYAANLGMLEVFSREPNFQFWEKDIKDLNTLWPCDIIINTAAETHVDNSIASSKEFIDSNVYGVHNLLNLITKSKWKPLLLQFSTDEVYGDIVEGSHTETDALKPSNPYSATKAAADMLISAWSRTYGIEATIVRPTNNYGCYQYPEKLIPCICKAVIQKGKFPLHNQGTPRRTWLHVADTADAIIHIIKNDLRNQIFNIGGNYEESNLVVAQKVVKLLTDSDDITPYCDFNFTRAGQDVRYSVDCSKLKSTGWTNHQEFDKALPSIVDHYKWRFTSIC